MVIDFPNPIGLREIVFKRYIHEDEKRKTYTICYSSLDLEKHWGDKSPTGTPRAYFGSPCGILLKPNPNASTGDINKNYTKIYYGFTLDFGKSEVSKESQLKIIPDFLLDFIERASSKAAALTV